MKLNQVIALVQGKKSRTQKMMTNTHHGWKPDLVTGISRTFEPVNDEGETFPSENKPVQLNVSSVIASVSEKLADFYSIVASQEMGNTEAAGSIIIDGVEILGDVPVSALLFLEKQVVDLRTFICNIPTLTTSKIWSRDEAKDCYATLPEQTVKTQKRPEVIVKYDATPEHPAQTDLVSIDRTVGHWTTVHMSGEMPVAEKQELLRRIDKLADAIKIAREDANCLEVTVEPAFGENIMKFVFGE